MGDREKLTALLARALALIEGERPDCDCICGDDECGCECTCGAAGYDAHRAALVEELRKAVGK